MGDNRDKCLFCRIFDGKEEVNVLYRDENFMVFPDIVPASQHHYLVITKEHIPSVRSLTARERDIVIALSSVGKQVLEEHGGNANNTRYGYHWPPFTSVRHLHLHVISPADNLSFKSRIIFRPNSWWFVTPEYILSQWPSEEDTNNT